MLCTNAFIVNALEQSGAQIACMDVLEDCTCCSNLPNIQRPVRQDPKTTCSQQHVFDNSTCCDRTCYTNENCNPMCGDALPVCEVSCKDSDVSSSSAYQFDADDVCAMDRDLVCTEPLSTADSAPCHSQQSPAGFVPTAASLQDLILSISAAREREAEEPAEPGYLRLHGPEHSPQHFITPSMRNITAGWMVEVAMHFNLQPDTLFLAISLLDRYLSKCQGYPRNMLQLLAVTCILVASKQEEVAPPTVEVLTEIAAHCFQNFDLIRLEHHLLEILDWRVQPPTVFSFLSLYGQALQALPWNVFHVASYFAELAVVDYETLYYPASVLATSSLLLSCAAADCHHLIDPLLQLSGYTQDQISGCYRHLLGLHNCVFAEVATEAEHQASQPFVTVNEKHSEIKSCHLINKRIELC